MVYEKAPESTHQYEDGIEVAIEDGYLVSADRTTLGADDGLALAYVLDILDREDLSLPDLEVLITTGEEMGLEGVKNLELTDLKGTYLINLDAEEEGVFFTSCAGGVRTDLSLPLEHRTSREEVSVTLALNGLSGGHSGLDIALGRANAIKILGRILYHVSTLARVSYLDSLGKANAIASKGTLCLHTARKDEPALLELLGRLEQELRLTYVETDHICFDITVERAVRDVDVLTEEVLRSIVQVITFLPCGVIERSRDDITMVQTSSNIGSMTVQEGRLVFLCSSRSSVKREKEVLREHMQSLAEALVMELVFHGDYPQWEYKKDSKLRGICQRAYHKCTGRDAVFTGIHAGIECGYLSEKLGAHIDMISCGADLHDVHTPNEKAELKSFYRMENILIEILNEIADLSL